MSEALTAEDNPTDSTYEAPAEAGALLCAARDAAGLRIEVLAASLKVPVAKLVALEAGDLSALPDRVFVRALVSSICRHLKVAPEPILAKLPSTMRFERAAVGASVARPSVRLDQSRSLSPIREWIKRPLVWGILLLLLGVLVMVFWPQVRTWGHQFMAADASAPQAVAPVATAAPVVALEPVAPVVSTPLPVQVVAVQPVLAPVPATVPAAEWLVLQAKGDAWVRITDAQNAVVLQKTMAAGESASVAAHPPLSVVIGRADVVDVRVRGIPVDLSASSGKVARFVAR
jgi:cytoskeleton protein RodZ